MIRALTLTCLIGALAVPSSAGAKPSICILGLEVKASSSGITQEDTKIAGELTRDLRDRSKAGGPFQWAGSSSERDLVDLKVMSSCDNEGEQCMSDIGRQLVCDKLMFGDIQKDKGGYRIVLRLLDVKTQRNEKSTPENIPLSDATNPAKLKTWAARLYKSDTGQASQGVLVVKANVDRGTVLINGEPKGTIVDGQATIEGLAAGRYKLAIEAEGFKRFEKRNVEVEDDRTTTENAQLDKVETKRPDLTVHNDQTNNNNTIAGNGGDLGAGHGAGPWKGLAIGGAIATGVFAITWGITGYELSQTGGGPFSGYGGNCHGAGTTPTMPATTSLCNNGQLIDTLANISGGIAVTAGVVTIIALVKWKTTHGASNEHARLGHRKHRPDLIVTPVVTPGGAAGMLRYDW